MLFDAKTPEAMQLLHLEWESSGLSDGVRSLIVEKRVQSVAAGDTESWEASVLSQLATHQALGTELKFCLFAPQWEDPTQQTQCAQGTIGGVLIPKAQEVHQDGLFDLFLEKGPSPVSVHSEIAAEKFRSVLGELEKSSYGSLQFLAKLKKLSLSNLFARQPRDDQGAFDEMQLFLTSDLTDVHRCV